MGYDTNIHELVADIKSCLNIMYSTYEICIITSHELQKPKEPHTQHVLKTNYF